MRADPQPGGAEHGPRHRHHRALPVRAADERAAKPALGMADLGHEPLDALEAEADPEAAALGEGRHRLGGR